MNENKGHKPRSLTGRVEDLEHNVRMLAGVVQKLDQDNAAYRNDIISLQRAISLILKGTHTPEKVHEEELNLMDLFVKHRYIMVVDNYRYDKENDSIIEVSTLDERYALQTPPQKDGKWMFSHKTSKQIKPISIPVKSKKETSKEAMSELAYLLNSKHDPKAHKEFKKWEKEQIEKMEAEKNAQVSSQTTPTEEAAPAIIPGPKRNSK